VLLQLGARSLEWVSSRGPGLSDQLCRIDALQPEAIHPALALLRAIGSIPGGGGSVLREHASPALPALAAIAMRDTADNTFRVSVMHALADVIHGASATHDDAAAVGGMLHPTVDALMGELAKLSVRHQPS
jgi:hypothetical protein